MTSTGSLTCCKWSLMLPVILSILARTEISSAKALGMQDGFWSALDDVSKRNTWWSKKSLESAPSYEPLLPDVVFSESTLEEPSDSWDLEELTSLYDCYVQSCMPKFVACAKKHRAGTTSYRRCKLLHRVCAYGCYLKFNNDEGEELASD